MTPTQAVDFLNRYPENWLYLAAMCQSFVSPYQPVSLGIGADLQCPTQAALIFSSTADKPVTSLNIPEKIGFGQDGAVTVRYQKIPAQPLATATVAF